ncbi:MAG: hypothetical protein RIE53_09165 [Rhodothermales bacterium]
MESTTSSTPRHLWIVGILSLLWNAMGAFDYSMTQFQVESYMSNFTPEQLEFFYGFPWWLDALWAIAVWGSVLGSLGLLLRKAWAVPVFGASLVCMMGTTIHNYFIEDGMAVMGGIGVLVFSMVIFIVAVFLFIYARRMRDTGVLT